MGAERRLRSLRRGERDLPPALGSARRPQASSPPERAGASGRDAAPGPGAAPRRLLALPAAALRAPPALGPRAGDTGRAPEVLLQGDGQLPTHLPVPAPAPAAPATPAPTASQAPLRPSSQLHCVPRRGELVVRAGDRRRRGLCLPAVPRCAGGHLLQSLQAETPEEGGERHQRGGVPHDALAERQGRGREQRRGVSGRARGPAGAWVAPVALS